MHCSHLAPSDLSDPLRVEDAWLTETVLHLARGIAADDAYDRLPILADALEDAGGDNFALLNHLRSDVLHRVECWALRRLLRTTLTLPGGIPMVFAYCPPGAFTMSSETRETAYDERPVRRVTLTRGFYAGIYPVTRQQWRTITTRGRVSAGEDRHPVTQVPWQGAINWCSRAASACGHNLRLPTEAEWEYACRGGTTTEYHWGDTPTRQAMTCDPRVTWETRMPPPPRGHTTEVGLSPPNPWGLFDCHGNVWEWCRDMYVARFYAIAPAVDPVCTRGGDGHRVIRGGSFTNLANLCRSASRYSADPITHADNIGFRVVFTV